MKAEPTFRDAAAFALLPIVVLLSACASKLDPPTVSALDGCPTEIRREIRSSGPPSKSPPMLTYREVQVCAAAQTLASR